MKTDYKNPLLNRVFSAISPGILFSLLLILICITYSNSLYSPLVLDDIHSFVDNPNIYVENFSISSLKQLSHTRFGTRRLIPIITFAMDHYIALGHIVQFHVTNIFIHIITTLFLYLFLTGIMQTDTGKRSVRFIEPRFFCLFIAALWALHPIQTNGVTYIVQRMAAIATLFYLAALTFYIRARISRSITLKICLFSAAIISSVLAFMSKENSFTLPVAILFVELLFISPGLAGKIQRSIKWQHWLIFIIIILALLPLGENYWNSILKGYDTRHFTLTERLLTQSRVVVFYVSLLLLPLPYRLNLDHDVLLSHSLISPPTTLLCLLLLISLLITSIRIRKTNPFITFGILWFCLNLIIESSVVPLELIFEHRLYLPSIGFFLVIVSLADRACNHFALDNRQTFQNIFLLGIIIVSCILSSLTTIRNHAWRDQVSLWRDCAEKSPYKPRPLINYGIALEKAGSQDEAMVALEKGMAVGRKHYEEYLVAASNIVYIHFSKGEFKEARHRGEKFLNSITAGLDKSGLPELALNMARVYRATGEPVKSFLVLAHGFDLQRKATYLLQALEIMLTETNNSIGDREKLGLSGEPVDISLKIALMLLEMREYEKCALYLNKALKLNPHHEKSLETKKRLIEHMEKSAKAIHVSNIHNDQDFRENRLFRFYMSLADFIFNNYTPLKFMAGGLVEAAGKIRPDNPFVDVYLARRHMEMEHMEAAVRTIEKSIPDNPDFPPLLELAGLCYMKTDKPVKAAIAYQQLLEIYPGHPNWKRYNRVIQRAQQELSERQNMSN